MAEELILAARDILPLLPKHQCLGIFAGLRVRPPRWQDDNEKGNAMARNEGTVDRVLRVIVGLVLIALVFVGPQTPWGWVGLVPLLTGLVGMCPLYSILGINTCKLR